MNAQIRQLVQKVWSFCDVLRDDGITYQDYISELSWLLFLCISERSGGSTTNRIPSGFRWSDLVKEPDSNKLDFYQRQLTQLALADDPLTSSIFSTASTSIRHPSVLAKLVELISSIDWQSLGQQALGDVYEGLLERNATEQRSGAGQYFTPRFLVDLIVRVVDPQPAEVVQDPAAGTGGFLVAAARHASAMAGEATLAESSPTGSPKYVGIELVQSAHRLCLMNLFLHEVRADLRLADALTSTGAELPPADVVLSNPPFGSKRGAGIIARPDLSHATSNKQLAFLQHIYRALKHGGRAAVIVPDGVLFDEGVGRDIRREMMSLCDRLVVLRLPSGIFYAQGVKTNVLFFRRIPDGQKPDTGVWVYDARSGVNARASDGKLNELLGEFQELYRSAEFGDNQQDTSRSDRYRHFSEAEVIAHAHRLDLGVQDEQSAMTESKDVDPAVILQNLRATLVKVTELTDEFATLFTDGGPDAT
ncbi:type I restriction-modification system subunit M [Micromonospora sp. RHAY321]|uniref:class I SAM-dependent DNA methyltransferase n=1 Tax=Micromonospora sp. RHAY321 TaxID=2944807 RepID=UPI00207C2AAB|nr:N-6 DNA methylase [Micromonospora sp. RHAY321]MCO1595681.1 type I restriction-modification system subunit M [Micromonospora sp. RHAY321]